MTKLNKDKEARQLATSILIPIAQALINKKDISGLTTFENYLVEYTMIITKQRKRKKK